MKLSLNCVMCMNKKRRMALHLRKGEYLFKLESSLYFWDCSHVSTPCFHVNLVPSVLRCCVFMYMSAYAPMYVCVCVCAEMPIPSFKIVCKSCFPVISPDAAAKSLQSCPTLCDPIDSSPPGSPLPGILQAKTLEWVAISFSNAWKQKVKSESEVAQSYPTLSNPMDCSLPGFSIHGIFQARVLEWGAIAFSESRRDRH